jgi:hypothetical protein
MANGWFPSINGRGDVVSGNSGIWLNGAQVSPFGIGPLWLTDDVYMFGDGNGLRTHFSDGQVLTVGYNYIRTNGAGKWAGCNGEVIDVIRRPSKGQHSFAGSVPMWDGDTLYWVKDGQTTAKTIVREGVAVFGPAPVMSYAVQPLIVETFPHVINGSPNVKATDEGGVLTHNGWLLTNVGTGLAVRPVSSVVGFFLAGENWYNPDFRIIGDLLIVAASTANGQPNIAKFDIASDPRIDLKQLLTPPRQPSLSILCRVRFGSRRSLASLSAMAIQPWESSQGTPPWSS